MERGRGWYPENNVGRGVKELMMTKLPPMVTGVFLLVLLMPGCWQSSYDAVTSWSNTHGMMLSKSCMYGFGLNGLYSVYDRDKRDRLWRMNCVRISAEIPDDCKWTFRFINRVGQKVVNYTCPADYYITGLYSDYDPRTSDRSWRVECCHSNEVSLGTCIDTDTVNQLNGTLEFNVPSHFVLQGIRGLHEPPEDDPYTRDRVWWFRMCQLPLPTPSPPRRRPGGRRRNRNRSRHRDDDGSPGNERRRREIPAWELDD